jgi:signal transduction histidine kinase
VSTALFTVVIVGGTYGEAHPANPIDRTVNGHPVPHAPPEALLLVGAACLALAGRRRRPLLTLAVSTAGVMAFTVLGYVNGAALLAPAVALYAAARTVTVRRALVAGAVTLVALLATTGATNPLGVTGGGFDLIPFLMAAACLGGIAVTSHRAYIASIESRARQEARQRVDEERLRIARELHDVVAHTMATINVQAGVAAHLLDDGDGGPAAAALVAIRDASKQGLQELRSILKVLRQADEGDPTQPAPGLQGLAALVQRGRDSGLPCQLQVAGAPRLLPVAVELAAYRIAQESLTNAIRHAPGATAQVNLAYESGGVALTVANSAGTAPRAGEGTGHGVIGMRERALSVGGHLDAGPTPGGGWEVRAWLPSTSADTAGAGPASVVGERTAP